MIALHAARVLAEGREVHDGYVLVVDDVILAVRSTAPADVAVVELGDADLVPGLVDLHSDCLEQKTRPRPTMELPLESALLDLDGEVAGHGITTHYLCVSLDDDPAERRSAARAQSVIDTLSGMHASLRVDHRVHLRVDVATPDLQTAREIAGSPWVGLMSFMDHTPGQGQYPEESYWRDFYRANGRGAVDIDAMLARKRAGQSGADDAREIVAQIAHGLGAVLASHDDDNAASVARAIRLGATISEFPVTLEAARSAVARGLGTVMGAPNARRGGSHVDNLSAREALAAGCLTALASDYHPPSLLVAAYGLADAGLCSWAEAMALVTTGPARMAGLSDRGTLAPGSRADMVAVVRRGGRPVVRQTWVEGRPVLGLPALEPVR